MKPSSKITCMRLVAFDTAHRLIGHEGKCRNLHGHRYVAEIWARADRLDPLGRVVDFSVLKERIGGWVDAHWDHTSVLHKNDPIVKALLDEMRSFSRPFYLVDFNPTAENLAAYLLRVANEDCLPRGSGLQVFKIVLHETPNCSATAEL